MQLATNSLSDFETPPARSISTDGPGEMDSAQNSPMDAEAMEILGMSFFGVLEDN
jgi:hypothetical protein